jgi:hypothetical protein
LSLEIFNTDPTDARFVSEGTFASLREKFVWAWENILLAEWLTLRSDATLIRALTDFYSGGASVFPRSGRGETNETSMEVNLEKQPRSHVGFRLLKFEA